MCTIKTESGWRRGRGPQLGWESRKTAFTFVILSRFVVSYLNTKLRGSKRIQLRAGLPFRVLCGLTWSGWMAAWLVNRCRFAAVVVVVLICTIT